MKSNCYPFREIPHTSKLFLDYLDFSPTVQPFYSRSPRFLEWAEDERTRIQYPAERRNRVASILERQNRNWAVSETTLKNIDRLRSGACAIVTGQQVGLFGGPVFSIYKALSAVKLAEEARKLGIDCVPIFWLATEDHDLEEVNQVRRYRNWVAHGRRAAQPAAVSPKVAFERLTRFLTIFDASSPDRPAGESA